MNTDNQLKVLAATVMLVFAGIAGAAGTVAAETSGNTAQSAGNFAVDVDQAGNYEVTVTVTNDGSAVDGATVDVTSDSAYADTGSHQTGADGTVTLSAPAEPTTVTVVATKGELTGKTTTELKTEESFMNFGQRVSYFVHGLLDGTGSEGGIGQFVSDFVKKHNPSNDNKPEHAGGPDKANKGKPEHAGGPDKGKPDNTGEADKKDKGKPEHAGGPDKSGEAGDDDGQDDETPDEETAASEETDTRGNGPDGDGHPGNGNGKK